MDGAPSSSRPAPPAVAPVSHRGVRYQQDGESLRHGGTQASGYLVAVDPVTGARLWMLKVYEVADPGPDAPMKLERWFRSLQVVPGEDALEVENEVGSRYRVDLVSRTAIWLSGPV